MIASAYLFVIGDAMDCNAGISAVIFGATWCGPCKMLEKTMKKIQQEFPAVKYLHVDIDEDPLQTKNYKIRSVPTTVLLKNGKEINRIVGNSKLSAFRSIFVELSKDIAA